MLKKILWTAIFLWFVLSYFEVICKNVAPNPQYSDINIFFMIARMIGGNV